MWICDLKKAIADVERTHPHTLFEKITACADGGLVFYTTYKTHIKWYPDGRVEERDLTSWRS